MLNRLASLTMSTCVLKALPGKLDIKRHSPSILYIFSQSFCSTLLLFTGPRSSVGDVSVYRFVSDCRTRGCKFDPGPVPYFHGD